jgi:hypothetical protein
MSCHESLMARRRKKSRAAANAKLKKEEQSPMLVDKSLPALPPNAILQSAFSPDRETPPSVDIETPTELSPRTRQIYQNDSSSRSSSRKPRERSPERRSPETTGKDGLLPTTTYRNNRHSAISQASDIMGDNDYNCIPLALDPSPAPSMTPRSTSETWPDPGKKENKPPEKDYFTLKGRSQIEAKPRESSSSPHIAFQEKGRQPSAEEASQIKESIRKAQAGGKTASTKTSSPTTNDETRVQHASPPTNGNTKPQGSGDKFRLGDVPKGKRSGTSRNNSQSDLGHNESPMSKSSSGGLSAMPARRDGSSDSPKTLLTADKAGTPRSSQESRFRDDDHRPSYESSRSIVEENPDKAAPVSRVNSGSIAKSIPRKEIGTGASKNTTSATSATSSHSPSASSSSASSASTPGVTPTVNGRSISSPLHQMPLAEDLAPSRAPTRPAPLSQQLSDTYMTPRAAPPRPPITTGTNKEPASVSNGLSSSPNLPRWSAGDDFTMDEDMARILGGTDENSQSILRRVSNAVRHGRTTSETSLLARHPGHGRSISETTNRTAQSPRWSKTPIPEDTNLGGAREISSPISVSSPLVGDDPALLRRQLRNSEQRVAELERQFASEKDLKTLNKKLIEKRKTVSVLDSQTEIMIRQLEVLAGYVERAKDTKQPLDVAELEESAIKEFVQKLERLKQTMAVAVETLYQERNDLVEEKNQIMASRDQALIEFEQLSSKNAQLADMNNDLTHQIQERFKNNADSPRPPPNGLGIYTHHTKDWSNASIHDDSSLRPSSNTMFGSVSYSNSTDQDLSRPSTTTMFGSVNYSQSTDQDQSMEPATVLNAPHVVNIRKGGQVKKFNWKKGGQTVAKGMSKGFKGAFASVQQPERSQPGDSIGMPYNMTVAPVTEAPIGAQSGSLPRSTSGDPRTFGVGGLFKSKTMPKSMTSGSLAAAEDPSKLFGSDLVERADYERRQIPSVITRCIEEVELRGMDIEGIYRKTGGSGQVKLIQEGFERVEDFDISDPGLDITAVTSVLKQYFRKLPVPLLTFDVYDRILESICKLSIGLQVGVTNIFPAVEETRERCAHLRNTFNMLPPKHRDCLEFLIFHLARVAMREGENLVCY